MSKAIDRVSRMLALLAYLRTKPAGVSAELAAAELSSSPDEVLSDARRLMVWCSLPGAGPDELIDFEINGSNLRLINAQGLDRPLRLTAEEAMAIIVAARSLASIPGIAEPEVLESAIEALEQAASPEWLPGAVAASSPELALDSTIVANVTAALSEGRALFLSHLSPIRDEVSDRTIDPVSIRRHGDHSYLFAWCRRAEGYRSFRMDRIVEARVLDEPAVAHEPEVVTDFGPIASLETLPTTTVVLLAGRRWQSEYIPHISRRDLSDGSIELVVAVTDEQWLERLFLSGGGLLRLPTRPDLEMGARDLATMALRHYA